MDTLRFVWALLFVFSVVMVWEGWQKQQHPAPVAAVASNGKLDADKRDIPVPSATSAPAALPAAGTAQTSAPAPSMTVRTDVLKAVISAEGGSLVRVELLKHKAKGEGEGDFVLLDGSGAHHYVAESGLIGGDLPNHRSLFQLPGGDAVLTEGKDEVQVRLTATSGSGVAVDKVYTFHRGS